MAQRRHVKDLIDSYKMRNDVKSKGQVNEFNQIIQGNSLSKDAWKRLRKNKAAVVGMVVVFLYAIIALCAPILPIYSYEEIIIDHQYLPPSFTKTAGELMTKRALSELFATSWRQGRLVVTPEQDQMLEKWVDEDKTSKIWDWCYEEGLRQLENGTYTYSASEQRKVDRLENSIKNDIQVSLGTIKVTNPENNKKVKLDSLDAEELYVVYAKVAGAKDISVVKSSILKSVDSQIETEVKTKSSTDVALTAEELASAVALEKESLGEKGIADKAKTLLVQNIESLVQSKISKDIQNSIKAGEEIKFPYKKTVVVFDDVEVSVKASLKNSRRYYLGTDNLGRDLLSRIIYGGRISILIGLVGTVTSVIIGIIMGSIAGYFGGTADFLIMRFVDILYGLPYMLLVIICMAIFGNNIINLFFALAMVSWLTIARMVRGQIMSLKNQEYIEAARSMGASGRRIIFKHLVPNSLSVIIVYSTLRVPEFIMQESFLSFLGLGISAPLSSWGSLIGDSTQGMTNYPWRLIFPSIVMTLFLFSMNFFGDGLRDAFDPQSKNML